MLYIALLICAGLKKRRIPGNGVCQIISKTVEINQFCKARGFWRRKRFLYFGEGIFARLPVLILLPAINAASNRKRAQKTDDHAADDLVRAQPGGKIVEKLEFHESVTSF